MFGDPDARIVDLRHDGRFEFLTADDSFAYRFTDFAASGLPIEILTFAGGHFTDVHAQLSGARGQGRRVLAEGVQEHGARQAIRDSVGVIAAWAADEDLLGHVKLVNRYLHQQAAAGHLNAAVRAPAARGSSRSCRSSCAGAATLR